MIRTRLLAAPVLLLAIAGCTTGPDHGPGDPADAAAQIERLSENWTLVSIRGGPDIRPALGAAGVDAMPSLIYDADSGRIAGSGGVNRWSAALDTEALARGEFIPGPAMSTMMAGPDAAMRVEQAFLAALSQAARFDPKRTGDGVLLIRDEQGDELLRFEKAP
jgi:heat shock protein HslJ